MGAVVKPLVAVSWCMPPALFPRSIQVARLLKGLNQQGWSTTVVAPALDGLGAATVIDAELGRIYQGFYNLVSVDLALAGGRSLVDRWRRFGEWRRGERRLAADDLWVARATRAAVRALTSTASRTLITFAQPWSDHLVGLNVAARRRDLFWVAHFSDPWVDSLYLSDLPEAEQALNRQREAAVVERADAVVFTNPYAAELVMRKYPESWRRKAHSVPHSMDHDLLPLADRLAAPREGRRAFRIAYVGNLFVGRRTAHDVLDALSWLRRDGGLESRLELVIVGEGSGLYEARCRVFELALEGIVTFVPRVSHVESLAAMRDADMLLLLDAPADTNVFLPSKVVDYLMAGRPILAVTPGQGASADVMRARGHAVVAPGDVPAIAAMIRQAMDAVPETAHQPPASEEFALAATARQFAAILEPGVSQ